MLPLNRFSPKRSLFNSLLRSAYPDEVWSGVVLSMGTA